MKTRPIPCILVSLLFGALLLSTSSLRDIAAHAQGRVEGEPFHKVVAPPSLLDPNGEGVELLQEYGSFNLYRLSESALAMLPPEVRSQTQVVDEMDRIMLGGLSFNPRVESLKQPPDFFSGDSAGPRLELVQFVGPVKDEWLAALEASGSRPVHYIANNAYLVWTDESGRTRLDALVAQGDFMQYRIEYQPFFKLGASLRERVGSLSDPGEILPVVIQLYRHEDNNPSKEAIARLSVDPLSAWTPVLGFENIFVMMRSADIPSVAGLPDVTWIGERRTRELLDEVQGQILASNLGTGSGSPGGPGYLSWLDSYGFSHDPGDYPVIDVTDDGIGDGTLGTGDLTLHRGGASQGASRLAYLLNCTPEESAGGEDGHGHLNASIAGGYDSRLGFPYQDPAGFNLGLGVNPFGRLAGTRVFSTQHDISNCGGTDSGVIQATYDAGGRISSNSWGCSSCASEYDESSQAYDAGVRDADLALPGNQSMTFVFAAGNSGRQAAGTVGTPGNAKNVITVGASESIRPTWTDGCSVEPAGADNPMDIIAFSSRGPAPGGRVKPDLIAPGTHIQGTASTHPGYTGTGICDPYQPGGQVLFAASSGTSHSAPAVAGVASLYTYWLEHSHGLPDPSPALIKAYLVAHTTYMTGEGAADDLPSNSQGFGLPDMSAAFDDTPRHLLDQSVLFDRSGETWTFNGAVADRTRPVRIILAYTDQAGMLGTSPQVNDLNLKVALDDLVYLGNHFQKQWSVPGGEPDALNNIEAIYLPPGLDGNLDITVTAFNIAGDGVPNSGDRTDQDFALVCYNCQQVARQDVCAPQTATYTLPVGEIPGRSEPLTLSASGQPQGTAVTFDPNPVQPPGTSQMTVAQTGEAPVGSYTIDITGTGETEIPVARLELNLFNRPPSSPGTISPAFGAVEQPLRPAFLWSPSSQAATYEIEIASDPLFTDLVLSGSSQDSPGYSPFVDLSPGSLYYWRVRSHNPCGMSAASPPSLFITAPAAGECSLGSTPQDLFRENFETGASGWIHGGSGDTWTLSPGRGLASSTAYFAIDPASSSDQWLISPLVSLPKGEEAITLQFWNAQSLEKYSSTGCYDGAVLEISTDEGQTWRGFGAQELLTDPYDGRVNPASNPLYNLQAWCGDPQDWLNSIVDLAAYAGRSVQFRFRLGSDSSIGRGGWAVDEVAVRECQRSSSLAFLGPDSLLKVLPGERAVHHFILRNLGEETLFNLSISGGGWPTALMIPSMQTVSAGGELAIPVEVSVPSIALAGDQEASDTFTLEATRFAGPVGRLAARGTTGTSAHAGVGMSPDQAGWGMPGEEVEYTFTLTNQGDLSDRFTLIASGAWMAELSSGTTAPLLPGESAQVTLQVKIPAGVSWQDREVTTLRASSTLDGSVYRDGRATTEVGPYRVWMPIVGRK